MPTPVPPPTTSPDPFRPTAPARPPLAIACACGSVADLTIMTDAAGRPIYVCRNPQHGQA